MLKEIRYMSGSEMIQIILPLAVLLSCMNAFRFRTFLKNLYIILQHLLLHFNFSPSFYRYLHTFFSK